MVRYPFGAKINRKQFFYLLTLCFLIGLFTPYLATVTSIKGLSFNYESSDFRCYTGVVVFTFFGYMISLIGVPLIGIILLPKKKTNYS
ncbi:hypothetical protein JKP34_08645 [Marivirga atlantica]|uniref:Uncharacterized protein n=2 Tax=Marivirga atlantica TaxID=1548457 RepID=A0A937AF25_9BACT|nr:hypothetical protein [Marivirga atlantica]